MRPMDSSGVHNSHGGANWLPPLPCWLWIDHLLDLHHLKQVQVINILIYMYTVHENIQVVWLKKYELEPLLQLDQHLSGEMAANHQRNLRQHQHHLRRRAAWTHETKIPTSHDWGRTTFSSFRGEWFRFITAKIKTFYQKGNPKYNAYDKDIAVFNLYFGDSTVFGKFSQYLSTQLLFAQSTSELPRWPGWTSSLALGESVDFVLESALSLSLSFSTGFRSGFVGLLCVTYTD